MENKEKVIKLAISYARKHGVQKSKEKSEILEEITKRIAQNKQKKNMTDLNRIERTLRKLECTAELPSKFPELDICKIEELTQLLEGRCIGKNIIHSWYDEETQGKKAYYGRFEKQLRKGLIRVGYWTTTDEYDNAEDYKLSKYALAADLITGELAFL